LRRSFSILQSPSASWMPIWIQKDLLFWLDSHVGTTFRLQ
jgi:hypothetical protein